MRIKFRGSFRDNNMIAYITLNASDLKKVDTREAAMLFETLDVNYDNDTICVFIPNIDVKNDIIMRYRVAKEWGLKKCSPTEIPLAKKRLGALINRLNAYRELYDVETQAYEECLTTRHSGLMWTREIALEEHLEGVIKNCENQKRAHEEALAEIDAQTVNIQGKNGTYTCIGTTVWHGRQLRLMESTVYGEDAPCCIIDDAGVIVVNSTWDGWGILADIDDVDAEGTPATLSHPRTDYQVWVDVSRGIHVRRPPHIKAARKGLIFRRSSSCPLRVTGACDIDDNFVYLYTSTHLFTVARATGEWGCRRAGSGRYTLEAHERYRSRCAENRTLTLS